MSDAIFRMKRRRFAAGRAGLPAHGAPAGLTRVEVLVLAVLGVFLAAALVMIAAGARGARPRVICADNLRLLGLAILAYREEAGQTPSADANLPALLAPDLGDPKKATGVFSRRNPFLCPQDGLNDLGDSGTSYAFNCTTVDRPEAVQANARHSPFSLPPASRLSPEDVAPDTILMIEYWGRDFFHPEEHSILDFADLKRLPKHALRTPPDGGDPYALLESPAHALSVDAAGLVQRPMNIVHEWQANQVGYRGRERTFHGGGLWVLFAEGSVLWRSFDRAAKRVSWTRQAD